MFRNAAQHDCDDNNNDDDNDNDRLYRSKQHAITNIIIRYPIFKYSSVQLFPFICLIFLYTQQRARSLSLSYGVVYRVCCFSLYFLNAFVRKRRTFNLASLVCLAIVLCVLEWSEYTRAHKSIE